MMSTSERPNSNLSGNPIDIFIRQATETPDQLALISLRSRLTYKQLHRICSQTARKLSKLGIKSGDVVGVQGQPEITVVLWLALMQLGAASLHVNTNTLRAFEEHGDFVIVDNGFTKLRHKNLITIEPDFFETIDAVRPLDEVAKLGKDDLVRVVFSSGTTGVPKGVPFTVETFLARVESARLNWIPVQPFMSLLGPETVSGFQTVFAQLFSGNTCFLSHDEPGNWTLILTNQVKAIKTSPAKLADLIRSRQLNIASSQPASPLELIQVAGSLLSKSLASSTETTFGLTPTYLYGSTEVGTVARGKFDSKTPNMVGQVISEVNLEIVDDQGRQVSSGVSGFLRIRREKMPTGYWQESQTGFSGFRGDWFYPGDHGHINADNKLVIEGRVDDVTNSGGTKVNLAQLDQVLGDIKEVSDVATFEFTGDFDEKLLGMAYCSDMPIETHEIERLAGLMTPGTKFNAFLRLDSLPRNNLGKVQRKQITELIEDN